MDAKNIVLVGLKGAVLAYQKNNGARLWTAKLKSSMSSDFVSVVADDTRVYAHTGGEFFCLDLQTGNQLWQDALPGLGYGIASLALPGFPNHAPAAASERKRHDDVATHSATSSSTH
jgi:outer membrane protein assembly factor BamB